MFRNWWRRWMRSQPRSSRRGRTAFPKPAWRYVLAFEGLETRALPSFAAPLAYNLGTHSAAGAVADFNGDGKPDLVTANTDGSVSVLLGNGDGSFQSAIRSSAGPVANALAVGDFNGDGIPDVVVTNMTSYFRGTTVSVLLGNGDGSFQSPVAYTVGTGPRAVAVADLGNGHKDIVTANDDGTVSVLLGRGDGTFQSAVTLAIGGTLSAVAVGDFDGDGRPDLAVSSTQYPSMAFVKVLLGNGDGSFRPPVTYSVDPDASSMEGLAVADLNGDGKLDLVATTRTYEGTNVDVLLGNGDGTFQSLVASVVTTDQQHPIAPTIVGDFYGDGKLDLVVSTYEYRMQVWVLRGNGDGTFQSALDTGLPGWALAAADFNGGGNLDLLVNGGRTEVGIARGHGDDTFTTTPAYAAGIHPTAVTAGDFTGSGKDDLVTVDYAGNVNVLLNHGDGTFHTGLVRSFAREGRAVVVGDFNGDGKQDIAVAGIDSHGDGIVSVYLGNGDGTFQAPVTFDLGFETSPHQLGVGDFNGDGLLDLAVGYGEYGTYTGFVKVLLSNGDGTFRASKDFAVDDDGVAGLTVGDFNGDGKPDLVAVDYEGSVSVLLGNGDGTFQSPVTFQVGDQANKVVSADLANRGIQDLIIVGYETVSVLRGNGDGTFQSPIVYPVNGPGVIVVGDFTGDGVLDLALIGDNSVSVLQGNGDGTFQNAIDYLAGQGAYALAVGDFNGDGALDLAAANSYSDDVSVLLNQPGASAGRRAAVKGGTDAQPHVTGLTVIFRSVVTADFGAFVLAGQNSGLVSVVASSPVVDGQSVLVVAFTGPGVTDGALASDSYTLTVQRQGIHDDLVRSLDQDFVLDFSVESTKPQG